VRSEGWRKSWTKRAAEQLPDVEQADFVRGITNSKDYIILLTH
jgi:hypothetical protein